MKLGRAAARARPKPVLLPASAEELASHASLLEAIAKDSKGACLWNAMPAVLDALAPQGIDALQGANG